MISLTPRRALGALLLGSLLGAAADAQVLRRPEPWALTDVSLDRTGADEARWTILLRDGRIEAILPAEDEVPHGYRLLDAEGAVALPGFVDACTHAGLETPEPVKDQDRPLDERSDVRIDMRAANRKGIQPAFRAVEAFAFDAEGAEGWQEAGFGVAHVAPRGELLGGTSVVAAARDAAARDLVLVPDRFQSAEWRASGEGFPSTAMGYFSQLRQFFLDARYHALSEERAASGRPGARPPFDPELDAGLGLLRGEVRLACAGSRRGEIERWLRLAGEFDLRLVLVGGGEAWRMAEVLASADVPVLLSLDWSEEVEDPLAAPEEAEGEGEPGEEAAEGEPGPEAAAEAAAPQEEEPAPAPEEEPREVPPADEEVPAGEQGEPAPDGAPGESSAEPAGVVWKYEEPLGVRVERRRRWEEERDNALRLHEAGVRLAFATVDGKPETLLENVRALVEAGLPAEAALRGLTEGAAEILGVEERVGKLEAGYDATLCLWKGDPLTDGKAAVTWAFVDGYPTEFDVEDEGLEGEPAEGVDLSGTWKLSFTGPRGETEATLVLEMDEAGDVTGSYSAPNPMEEGTLEAGVTGHVAGERAILELEIRLGEFTLQMKVDGTVEGDEMEGKLVVRTPWSDEPDRRPFRAQRTAPERTNR